MNTTSKTVRIECGRCVRGTFYYPGGSGPCYRCEGTGKVTVNAAKHAAAVAMGIAYQAGLQAQRDANGGRTDDELCEEHEETSYGEALGMIQARGVDGARAFFAAHRGDHAALRGLVGAMRDEGMVDASNKVVAHMNARTAARLSDGRAEFLASRKAR